MKRLFLVLGFTTTLAGGALAGVRSGQHAPEFALPTLKGARVSLSSLRGKVVLIDFWAQWCEPCKKELPQLERLAKEYAPKGVVVLTVNIDKQRENAEKMARQLGLTVDVLLDPAGNLAATFDLPKMPSSFVVDKKGVVRFVHEGFEGQSDLDRIRKELDELSR
jgi:peroxiredoxin